MSAVSLSSKVLTTTERSAWVRSEAWLTDWLNCSDTKPTLTWLESVVLDDVETVPLGAPNRPARPPPNDTDPLRLDAREVVRHRLERARGACLVDRRGELHERRRDREPVLLAGDPPVAVAVVEVHPLAGQERDRVHERAVLLAAPADPVLERDAELEEGAGPVQHRGRGLVLVDRPAEQAAVVGDEALVLGQPRRIARADAALVVGAAADRPRPPACRRATWDAPRPGVAGRGQAACRTRRRSYDTPVIVPSLAPGLVPSPVPGAPTRGPGASPSRSGRRSCRARDGSPGARRRRTCARR